MNITPDQARELLDGATPGPWCEDGSNIMNHDGDPLLSDGSFGDPNWYNVRNLTLMAAALDLAQTIAGMTWQWGVEKHDGHRWSRYGGWIGQEPIARLRLLKAREDGETARLVHRLVGPAEVVE